MVLMTAFPNNLVHCRYSMYYSNMHCYSLQLFYALHLHVVTVLDRVTCDDATSVLTELCVCWWHLFCCVYREDWTGFPSDSNTGSMSMHSRSLKVRRYILLLHKNNTEPSCCISEYTGHVD
jgi:hypothetical protein